jgi:taurine dioxygenase
LSTQEHAFVTLPTEWKVSALCPFGVELEGDLSQPLSQEARDALVQLVDRHGIVVARGQRLTLDQHRQLLAPLGRIEEYDLEYVALDDGVLNRDAMAYHSDFAYAHTPYKYLSLHALEIAGGESSTRFANGALAYQQLNSEQRRKLAALTTTAVSAEHTHRGIGYDPPAGVPTAIRAAVIFHHRTSHPILYVNESQHARFNELDRETSDALFEELFDILYRPDAIFSHSWATGDLLIWDNLSLQHGRAALDNLGQRSLQRVSVADVGGGDMLPGFLNL